MNELALFAGAGGGILGGALLGWRTVGAVEIDPYCRSVLLARQRDGMLEPFPIWDDVRTFDGRPWRGRVDVVSGGFPCQDISAAGRGAGIEGERSGLWAEQARIIGEVQPRYAFVENSPMLTLRGLGRVLGDLAEMGFNGRWGVLGAAQFGAPHRRDRIWIVAANPYSEGCTISEGGEASAERNGERTTQRCTWWNSEPDVGRVVHGRNRGMERIRALGNAQVPCVAASAWRILTANARNERLPEAVRSIEELGDTQIGERKMSTFSSDIGPEEEDGAGWGGLVATKQERQQEEREAYARKCVRACAGLPDGALDGGWTAAGIISYAKKLEETLSGIAFANYREWDDGLDTAEEFVRWAQSRAIHTLTQNVQKPECSICRRRHGPEVVHACE